MKKSRFTEEQIVFALKLAEPGIPVLPQDGHFRCHVLYVAQEIRRRSHSAPG
ncbi:UNVERIFIED_ORG: hypothetical protein J2806_000916 [Kosakonia oryzae]|uniref:Transposase n=1 Tax=Kosakonia radicincitans TaxID=283686 RepID=A0AAX2EKY3_9ENTR|nr:transposase [Kosakonia radicincitans UMEnt01/12]MDP9565283.1 hypothetical protein [Kosakonia oryzae]SET15822.1 hypothetical protein SAMN03159294_2897 [Kosakonia radicincitans]SFD85975.1 hypothetical protein SAMN03159468_00091 [Kosakonia radicincitans]SFQ95225.1 hypothetical protein SAMN03159514_00091 [Kosakonia radicincitans]